MTARSAFLVRGGPAGELESLMFSQDRVVFAFGKVGDITDVAERTEILRRFGAVYPDVALPAARQYARQLWVLLARMHEADLVALPLKTDREYIAVGVLIGPYEYVAANPEVAQHTRQVRWAPARVRRAALEADLRRSLQAFNTVSEIGASRAAHRLEALVVTGVDPGPRAAEQKRLPR